MSNAPNELRVRIGQARLVFGYLILVGIAMMVWGVVGPVATGAAFSEVVVDELGLPKDPETYTKLRELYSDSDGRKAILTMIVGLFILGPAAFGFRTIGRAIP